ncbi:hypothetical protein BJF78_08665 [Pseudonocardia sp. CNS-139]|nr:hypothetical protein BJF78_08665 [Pseudonocardia sp. CNS-139]
MEIVRHGTPEAYAAAAGPLLRADPLRHTIALTALDGMCRDGHPAAVLLTVHEHGEVTAALLRSPGRPALVSAVPPRLAAAVEAELAAADPWLPGAGGTLPEVTAFTAAYLARTGGRARTRMQSRLYALGELVPPAGVAGSARRAGPADAGLLASWRVAFAEEADGAPVDVGQAREVVLSSLRLGTAELLWEVDGRPVAQATARPVVAGMSRIGPVYTPPEHRGRGYAAAVTAAASRWALDAGAAHVVLFTDLANPLTNRLYPRLGYRPVHDTAELDFSS